MSEELASYDCKIDVDGVDSRRSQDGLVNNSSSLAYISKSAVECSRERNLQFMIYFRCLKVLECRESSE